MIQKQLPLFKSQSNSEQQSKKSSLIQKIDAIDIKKDQSAGGLPGRTPENSLLALNRGYVIKGVYISRILSLAKERQDQKTPLTRDDIAEVIGITWANTQGMANVIRRLELLRAKNTLKPFGELVLENNPYLDNKGLLWVMHYLLASNALLVLWSHAFNQLFIDVETLSVQDATANFTILSGRWSDKTLKEKVPLEIGAIFRSYTEGFFTPLRLLEKFDTGIYEVNSNTDQIHPAIWLACILIYRDRYYPGAPSLEIPLVVDAHYSPGRLFRQSELGVRRALDGLHNSGLLTVETRSGLDQVRFKRDITWLSALADYLSGV